MLDDLFFGRSDEAQVDTIAEQACYRPPQEAHSEECGVQITGSGVQFPESFGAPHEMVCFLLSCFLHCLSRALMSARQALPQVQSLRTNLTAVIDAHQATGFLPGLLVQFA